MSRKLHTPYLNCVHTLLASIPSPTIMSMRARAFCLSWAQKSEPRRPPCANRRPHLTRLVLRVLRRAVSSISDAESFAPSSSASILACTWDFFACLAAARSERLRLVSTRFGLALSAKGTRRGLRCLGLLFLVLDADPELAWPLIEFSSSGASLCAPRFRLRDGEGLFAEKFLSRKILFRGFLTRV